MPVDAMVVTTTNQACLDDCHKNALQEPAAKGRFNN